MSWMEFWCSTALGAFIGGIIWGLIYKAADRLTIHDSQDAQLGRWWRRFGKR